MNKNYKNLIKNNDLFDEETVDNSDDIINIIDNIHKESIIEKEKLKEELSNIDNDKVEDVFCRFIPINPLLSLS
ncbi:hypothetical protein LNJ03_11180 [Tenacibaculum dicentrarchi]|nr:hypothetical protein [Tenacibaculum dicentrarchi]